MTIVETSAGRVQGAANADGTVLSFRGIPFAAPPIGTRRFAAAQPAEPWEGIRDATVAGPAAPQVYGRMDELFGEPELPTSEAEALHLTVHTPDLAGRRPVFVWIHGGSFVSGSSALETYDTEHFARDGIVSVGINYRLGAFGFLDLVGLFPGAQCANPALTDAVMALRWIQENIARFGGDPDAVTIAGESAGAGMVTALLTSPLAEGLFRRAIPQSGINFRMQSPETARRIAENFLAATGVAPGDREALEALTAEQILEVSENREVLLAGVDGTRLAWNMHEDRDTLPRNVHERLAAGELAGIDMLLGTTADENKLRWLVEEPAPEKVAAPALEAELLDRLREVYRQEGRGVAAWEIDEAIGNDLSYLVPTTWAAEEHARTGGRTYMYLFTWRSPALGGRLGACHAMENAFVFDRLGPAPALHGEDPPQALADAMHRAWIAFAATGDPGVAETGPWPRYAVDAPQVMEFGSRIGPLADPRGRERRAWAGVPPTRFGVG